MHKNGNDDARDAVGAADSVGSAGGGANLL